MHEPVAGPPQRIQRRRTKGWRLPEGAVVVSRPSRWGNPFKVGRVCCVRHRATTHPFDLYFDRFVVVSAEHATRLFETAIRHPPEWQPHHPDTLQLIDVPTVAEIRAELAGKTLACWCAPGAHCHGDILLEAANEMEVTDRG